MRKLIFLTPFLFFVSGIFSKIIAENALFMNPVVTIRDASVTEGNGGSTPDTLRFVVERTNADTSFSISYSTSDSTAVAGDMDYEPTSGQLFFPENGALTNTIKVPVLGDNKTELDELLKVNLFGVSPAMIPVIIGDGLAIGSIINNDTSFISVRNDTLVEGNSGVDSLKFVVDLQGELDVPFNYMVMTMDSTATQPPDYFGLFNQSRTGSGSGVGTGSGSGVGTGTGSGVGTGTGSGVGSFFLGIDTICVAVQGERKTELTESFKVLLKNLEAQGRALFFRDSIGVGQIIDNDTTNISIADATLFEGNTGTDTMEFVVTLDAMVDSLAIVYQTMDSTALAGMDYVPQTDTIFMNCLLESRIKIPINGDKIIEPDEYFKVMLTEIIAPNRQVEFMDVIGVGTIRNDDFRPVIQDPCTCLENATSSDTKDGQFSETVTIKSKPGEDWYIVSVTGFFNAPVGAFPPAKGGNPYPLTPFLTGTSGQKLLEIDLGNGLSEYILNGIHVDDIGYEIVISNGTDVFTIGNECHYEKACGADQTIVTPFFPNVSGRATIKDCTANNKFISDGIHLYRDNAPRYNETTICPNMRGQILTVSFQSFDLAAGDTLFIYDGIDSTAALIAKGSGNSVSQINGGWVTSNCDPNINETGCLTFAFATNGDNRKGTGWSATINCALQGVTTLNRPDDVFASVKCDSLKTPVNLRMPTISRSTNDCVIANDNIIFTYCDVRDTLPAGQLTFPVFPFGDYEVTYKLLADTTITTSNTVRVAAPSLVCNDTVVTNIGQGCISMLTPDDLLESVCDTTGGIIEQSYTISIKTDKGILEGSTPNYPILDAGEGGNITCNSFYEVTIIRSLASNQNGCAQSVTTSCTSTVQFIDGIAPAFVNVQTDTLFGCHDMELTQSLLTPPTVIDNCEIDSLVANIPPNPANSCESGNTIQVIWTAFDACGNSSTAVQNITILRPTTIVIPKDTTLNCAASVHPEFTGWPKIDTDGDGIGDQIITDENPYCSFDIIYDDEMIPSTCGSSSNILRIFTLFDNCANGTEPIFVDTQFVLLRDTIAPIVSCPAINELGNQANPYKFRTEYNACTGLPGTIAAPTGMDNCDIQLAAIVTGVFRVADNRLMGNTLAFLSPLEVGAYRVAYVLRDDCGNTSEVCNVYFNIVDQTNPTAVCTDELIVSLANGDLEIRAEDIGSGSFDACGLDTLLIRRTICGSATDYPTEINEFVANKLGNGIDANGWSSSITIGCCDLNTSIRVQVLVIDKGGNFNKCWLTISPENQPQSACRDLPDAVGFCDNFATNYIGESTDVNGNRTFDEDEWQPIEEKLIDIINNQFGNPACNTNNTVCINSSIEQEYQLIRETCGVQNMRRRFRTRNPESSPYPWYHQNITIDYRPGWSFTFPADTVLQCGTTDVGNIPEMLLAINQGTCDQIGWEVKDQVFETEDGSCFKVLREWLVINGCQHSNVQNPFQLPRDQVAGKVIANSKRTFSSQDTVSGVPLNERGYFTYTQVILVMDSEAPIITVADVDTCIVGVEDVVPFAQADVTPGASPYECDTLRTFSATGMDCTASNQLDFSYEIFEGATRLASGIGSTFGYVVEPNRTYTVRFTASDNCGNIGTAERTYTFRDCRRPTALCQGVTLNLNNARTAILSANAINAYSYDNCTDSTNLELRIWHPALGIPAPTNVTEVLALPLAAILDCQYLGNTTANLYVVDAAQNYSLCGAEVTLTDILNVCPAVPRSFIAGRIQTELGDMVENVAIEVSGTGAMPAMETTDFSGTFRYEVASGADYTIKPKKTINPLNGVSTYDLVLIQKHILGLETFTSPYHYIAADINQSGAVTTFDMVILRQLILNILTDFPSNESWKFVNMAYPMNKENPLLEGYEEKHTIKDIQQDVTLDFMAVKIGDINGNARPNDFVASEDRNTKGTINIRVADQKVIAGQSYVVDFDINNLPQIAGYQFTLAYEGMVFEKWAGGLIDENYFGYAFAKRGMLTTSWNQQKESNLSKKEAAFQLKFTAKTDGLLSELLSIGSTLTPAEGYNQTGDLLDIRLVFEETTIADKGLELYQNRPNPFKEKTEIGFYLPNAASATLTIMDVNGKVVKTIKADYEKGQNSISLDRNDLSARGLLYYQLETAAGKMTKTMLVLD